MIPRPTQRPCAYPTHLRLRLTGLLAVAALLCGLGLPGGLSIGVALAQGDAAPAAATRMITVKLVTDFESETLVSDRERLNPVSEASFDPSETQAKSMGMDAELWVRNAHIDGKWFFERYYQDKYIGREGKLTIDAAQLEPGEHVIEPGHHVFTVGEDKALASTDPDIRIKGDTVLLRLHRVTFYGVDSALDGPPESRMLPATLGVYDLKDGYSLDPADLPTVNKTANPRDPKSAALPLTNVLSHPETFFPLRIWLPANTVEQGYVAFPSWQSFHVGTDGKVALSPNGAAKVPGVTATGETIVIPYRSFSGKVVSNNGLNAGVGNVKLGKTMNFSATLGNVQFRAGIGTKLSEALSLEVNTDFERMPYKYFVADNTEADLDAVRLMTLEWPRPVFTRGEQATIGLRLRQTPEHETLKAPEVRMAWSVYNPNLPTWRDWKPVTVGEWKNDLLNGTLSFTVPDASFGFGVLQVSIFEKGDNGHLSPLTGEIECCFVEPGQTGSASFVVNKGRDAFQIGEAVDLTLVIRSTDPRPAGERKVVLHHPDGTAERLAVPDSGAVWESRTLRLTAAQSARLVPGHYQLTVEGLPKGTVAMPFDFDLVDRNLRSEFLVVKPSKYTKSMNNLVPSHLNSDRYSPVDLDRAMETISDLGYNRVDLMTYLTNHHVRTYTWREPLAQVDPRLPPPAAVYQASPRDQILNACVRHGLNFSDVMLSYNDFHLPRQIKGYSLASVRWFAREALSMRHSPAFAGIMLYEEMYQAAVSGLVEGHQKMWADIRARLAVKELGMSPAKIEEAFQRYLSRPKAQRDPEALALFLRYMDWQQHSWAEYVEPHTALGHELAPKAKWGTFHRTFMGPGDSDVIRHGYVPDLFRTMDVISHIHYADNSTCWVHIPMIAKMMRTGKGKTLYVNLPVSHETGTKSDGQYQRMMAFALLQQGADGISMWGLTASFDDGANPGTLGNFETTKQLNDEILQPFGDVIRRSGDGYRKVGIVSTLNQQSLDDFKEVGTGNQTEELWVACWRLGYPAEFLRETDLAGSLEEYSVIFVPGVRFENELAPEVMEGLKRAAAAGVRVVVERGSELDMPGITHLDDFPLNNFFLGQYFPTWEDDELNKVYESSQKSTDYLRAKFLEWGVEPTARGEFQVGPDWRDGGGIDYLVMANFDDPPYPHAVKQIMANPKLQALQVPAHHGAVAYDLLRRAELPLTDASGPKGEPERRFVLDMTRVQGGIVAFLPARIGALQVTPATGDGRLQVQGTLLDEGGKAMAGYFPARLDLTVGDTTRTYFRTLGQGRQIDLDLPATAAGTTASLTVTELLSGRTLTLQKLQTPTRGASTLALLPANDVEVPYPHEVAAFLADKTPVTVIPGRGLADGKALATDLATRLKAQGIEATVVAETEAYRYPSGNPQDEDPLADGFHTWRGKQEVVAPAMQVDGRSVVLGGADNSFLIRGLRSTGFLSVEPTAFQGQAVRPTLQVAALGLSPVADTLCLTANTPDGVRAAIARLFEPLLDAPPPAAPAVTAKAPQSATETVTAKEMPPAINYIGSNELIIDADYDKAGNLYVITWGHGKNFYSFDPAGKLRWARFLPAMGANFLQVAEDRVLVYTAAGARLYQFGLDGTPLSQVRLNMDIGSTVYADTHRLSSVNVTYSVKTKQLIQNMGEKMRILNADTLAVVKEWEGETFEDRDVSDLLMRREVGDWALSPDGAKIAQIEGSYYFSSTGSKGIKVFDTHLVIRDLSGTLLAEYKNIDNFEGDKVSAGSNRVEWVKGEPGPVVRTGDERWSFDDKAQLLERDLGYRADFDFGARRRLVRYGRSLAYLTAKGEQSLLGPLPLFPTYAILSSDDRTIAMEDEHGLISVFDATNGKRLGQWQAPQLGRVLRFSDDNTRVMLGGGNGRLMVWTLDGKPAWQAELGPLNDLPGKTLPLHDDSIKDFTETLWPVSRDTPGDLDELARLGEDRVVNGSCETDAAWTGDKVTYAKTGHESARSLRVGADFVGQDVTQYLGRHVTWILEFQYRAAEPGTTPKLLAGVRLDNMFPDATVRTFKATDSWQFGRVVIKNGEACETMSIGFGASDGEVLVDDVSFRRIRFPSVNYLLYEPLYKVKPVVLTNPLFMSKYDPFGNIREDAPNKVLVQGIDTGAPNLVESAFLQNGRLNDMDSKWYVQPMQHDPAVSISLKDPRWISMVALYFNAYDAANILPHFDIYATDVETRKDILVASIRHNEQLFRLVKFPPVKTASLSIVMVNSIRAQRTLTEIEVYGPLSGREGVPGFSDADGQNAWMGDFTRVDKREKHLPTTGYVTPFHQRHNHGEDLMAWNPPMAQILAAEDKLYVSRAVGLQDVFTLADPTKRLEQGRANGIGFTPEGSLYGGLLLRSGNDGKFYCISPESGTTLWSVKLDDRLFGSAVALQEDVYVATPSGKLYQLDLANGSIMKDTALPDGVFGSLATDGKLVYLITSNGQLQAYRTADLSLVWTTDVAPYTDATPAVDQGTIYLADQRGTAYAIDAANGKVRWRTELGSEFTRCPVVTREAIVYGCRDGKLLVLDRATGKLRWQREANTRFQYEPVVADDQVIYFDGGSAMLIPLAGGEPKPLQWLGRARGEKEDSLHSFDVGDPIVPLGWYKGRLMQIPRHSDDSHTIQQMNYNWHTVGGSFNVLPPAPTPEAAPAGKEKKK